MTLLDALDYLTYCSYRHNRRLCPSVTPARWALIFGVAAVTDYELRYQRELATIPGTVTMPEPI